MAEKTYVIDPKHSHIGFHVKHMMFAHVYGAFQKYKARIKMDPEKLERAKISFTAQTKSIDTQDKIRDEHLKSPDFFDVGVYKHLCFKSTQILKKKEHHYRIKGLLTMRGITKPIELQAEYSGLMSDPHKKEQTARTHRIALILTGTLNRHRWGMRWNQPLQSGGILVSKEVKLDLECEFIEKSTRD